MLNKYKNMGIDNVYINGELSKEELLVIKNLAKKSSEELKVTLKTSNELKKLIEIDFGENFIKSLGNKEENGTQRIIKLQKYFGLKPNGIYSIEFFKKLVDFQKTNGLGVDGIPGIGVMELLKIKEKENNNIKTKIETIKYEKNKEIVIQRFNDYCENIYNSDYDINKAKKNLLNYLNKRKKVEKKDINAIYDRFVEQLNKKLESRKKRLKMKIDEKIQKQKQILDKYTNIGKDSKYNREATFLFNYAYSGIIRIGNIFISSYQTDEFEVNLKQYSRELKRKNYSSDLKLIEKILEEYTIIEIKKIESYVTLLKKLSRFEDTETYKKEAEKKWIEIQNKKYETIIKNGFSGTIKDEIETINFSSEENKTKTEIILREIGKDISKGDYLNKIRKYAKKYNVFIHIGIDRNLYLTVKELLYKIGNIKNVELTRKYEKNREKKHGVIELSKKFAEIRTAIDNTTDKAKSFLNNEKCNELKEKLDIIYYNGINSNNPIEYWNNYALLKKFDIKQPYYSHNNKKDALKSFDTALTITRIDFMQKDLIKRDYEGFKEIKKTIIIQNRGEYNRLKGKHKKRIFIIKKLKNLYGITGNVFEHLIDVEKNYGKIIDEIINKKIKEEKDYGYNLLQIFGTREKIKETILKLIIEESLGNPFTHNIGLSSSALGILQKIESNYTRFKINPFNPKESIESFLDNIVIAINSNISKKIIYNSNTKNRIKIAILIHYLGEGNTKNILKTLGGDIGKINKVEFENNTLIINAKEFLKKIDNSNYKIQAFNELGKIKLTQKNIQTLDLFKKLILIKNLYKT